MTDLLAIAEAPAAHIVPRHPRVVVGDGYVVSQMGPRDGAVQAIRLSPDRVDAAREEIRALAAEREWESFAWWVSDLTEPADLGERLGLADGQALTAMAVTREPAGEPTLEVRRVETVEQFASAQRIDMVAQGREPSYGDEEYERAWDGLRDVFLLWLAYDGDRPVGMARAARSSAALMLIGGATLPDARRRGVYRSLVHTRWDAAVALGTPALVVSANDESRPILEQLGFDRLGTIRLYTDRL